MPRTYQGVRAPEGFTKYMERKFKRRIHGLMSPYQFTSWMLSHHMHKKTLKHHINQFKKRKR